MRQVILVVAGVLITVSFVAFGLTYFQAQHEQVELSADLEYRTRLLASGLKESVEPYYINRSTQALQSLIDRLVDRERLMGLAVFDNKGAVVAGSQELAPALINNNQLVSAAMDGDRETSNVMALQGGDLYVIVQPLHDETSVIGAFMVVQDASYIGAAINDIWQRNIVRLLVQILIFTVAIVLLVRWVIFLPLVRLVASVRAARSGEPDKGTGILRHGFFTPLASEISKMTDSLSRARAVASEEARMRLEKLDSPWTAERLKEFIKAYVKNRPIIVVSNREPYIHRRGKNGIEYSVLANGMSTALESVMEACGGTWVAHGSGSADKETADADGKIRVPPRSSEIHTKARMAYRRRGTWLL